MAAGFKREIYRELHPGQHARVHDACRRSHKNGRPWLLLADVEALSGWSPAAGAVMALREQGKLQTRIGQHGRVEIAAAGAER
jgi:hypothetical protein